MDSDNTREELAHYVDRRVSVRAMYDCCGTHASALLQDAEIDVSEKSIDIGHLWCQHAESQFVATGVKRGDRIKCLARVNRYTRSDETASYSIAFPTEVVIVSRPIALTPGCRTTAAEEPEPEPKSEELSGPQLLVRLKDLVTSAGSLDRVQRALDIIKQSDEL